SRTSSIIGRTGFAFRSSASESWSPELVIGEDTMAKRTKTPKPPKLQSEELPNIPEPGDVADQAARSESMASGPSEEDIRLRAYHRYLERGGEHGAHFDDWFEAEKELKRKS